MGTVKRRVPEKNATAYPILAVFPQFPITCLDFETGDFFAGVFLAEDDLVLLEDLPLLTLLFLLGGDS